MKKQINKQSIVMLTSILAVMAVLSVLSEAQAFYHLPVDLLLVINCFIWSRSRKANLALLVVFPLLAVIRYSLVLAGTTAVFRTEEDWIFTLLLLAMVQMASAVGLRILQQLTSLSETLGEHRNWVRITILADILYAVSFGLVLSALLFVNRFPLAGKSRTAWLVLSLLLVLLEVASIVRLCRSEVFLFLRQRQDRILQSESPDMVLDSYLDMRLDKNARIDVYADVYRRLVRWFEEEKPYLKDNFTLNDAARETYTNKVYLSKAISKFSKKNFCQFVNFYRVRYAKQLFLSDMSLRVSDLSVMSGFHNPVSFNMAFQMFENITPGDWCNDQRNRTSKTKN